MTQVDSVTTGGIDGAETAARLRQSDACYEALLRREAVRLTLKALSLDGLDLLRAA